jgi:hypothetical protein
MAKNKPAIVNERDRAVMRKFDPKDNHDNIDLAVDPIIE